MALYTCEINGVVRDVLLDGFRLNLVGNGLDRCDFIFESETPTYRPAIDDEVTVKENGVAVFRGPITDAEEEALGGPALTDIGIRCSAIGVASYTSFKFASITLASGNLKSQLTTLVNTYLNADYGITLDAGQANGPTIDELIIVGMRIDEILNELSVRSGGWIWTVTADLELLMYEPGTVAAPYDLLDTGTNRQVGDVKIQRTHDDNFANSLVGVVTGAGDATWTQDFVAADGVTDGGLIYFTTDYPASLSQNDAWPNEFIFNGVNLGPVGFVGISVTNAWDWDAANHRLRYTIASGATFPTGSDTITVTHAIRYPFEVGPVTSVVSPQLVRERRIEIPQQMSLTAVQSYLEGLLDVSSTEIVRAKWASDDLGWRPGQSLTITLAKRNVNAEFLIEEVRIESMPGETPQTLRHSIVALQGSLLQGNWRNTPKSWLGGGTSGGASITGVGGDRGGADFEGSGHPQGQQVGIPGQTYRDITNFRLYQKIAGAGDTGWYRQFNHVDQPGIGTHVVSANAVYSGQIQSSGWVHSFSGTQVNGYATGKGHFTVFRAGSGVGNDASFFNSNSSDAQFIWADDFDQSWLVLTGSVITNIRISVGLGSAVISTDTYSGHFIIFRYSSTADSGWVGLTNDNTTQNVTSTIASIAANTWYVLRIRKISGTVYFSVDDATETVVTSKVPSTGQPNLKFVIQTLGGGVTHDLGFSRFLHAYTG